MTECQDAKALFEDIKGDLSFQDIKDAYEQKRENERIKLRDYLIACPELSNAGLKVVGGRKDNIGKGHEDYTSDKHIAPFDLRNWKWVEIKNQDKSFSAIISLNMPDKDPGSGNFHALYDRVGLILNEQGSGRSFAHMDIYTNIDLPFDKDAMEKITQIVIERFNIFTKNNKALEGSAS